ncbi:glycoside hydrolase family 73 protein [Labrenzia sp. VG12]|uniref:glycoside hydrolase family 73 protein n=1 Tax=Labrenzia sp. VG12 TaxID=2021862 RepID=UPI000B8C1193|nr:glucosaminidase domain-containing protein [Labrenzia sp. VG12]ASP33812.1 hypothetical protein CHH27_11620 [Labrenzia sp. VG12]
MGSKVNDFSRRIYIAARNIGLADPQARLAAAQSSVETGYGRSVKGHNYFGIKAGRSWTGQVQEFQTWEEENGNRVNIRDRFRKYNSLEESLKDWVKTVSARWPEAMSGNSFEEAVEGLRYGKRGGYATDSQYGQKLAFVERRIGDAYSPPSEVLEQFVGRTEADADLQNLLAGDKRTSTSPSIFDTHGVGSLNIEATPVPREKPGSSGSGPDGPAPQAKSGRGASRYPLSHLPLLPGANAVLPAIFSASESAVQSGLSGRGNRQEQSQTKERLEAAKLSNQTRDHNPFDLKQPDLRLQAALIESAPALAEQLIFAAGRDPRLFGL